MLRKHYLNKKNMILEVAEQLFASEGYTSTSIDDIASKCDITKAAIYYHFKNKQELYRYILQKNFMNLAQNIEIAVGNEDKVENKFIAYVITFAQEIQNSKHIASLLMREMANGGKDMPPDALKEMLRTFKSLTLIIKSGNEQKIFKCIEPMIMQMMIIGSLSFLFTTQKIRKKVKEESDTGAKVDIQHSFEQSAYKISMTLLNSLEE